MPTIVALATVSILLQATGSIPPGSNRSQELVPGPYDFQAATTLLEAELPQLSERVAVLVRQNGREIYRFQRGSIDFDTQTRMASLTKTVSAAVVLGAIEDGWLELDERLGDAYPLLFEPRGLGDPTVLDCWAMRHGLDARQDFERLPFYTHAQSVLQIGLQGFERFRPGEKLGYDGAGMQVSSYIAVERTGLAWEDLASQRILQPLGMNTTDYQQFAPNPAVAGGMRSTALDVMRFADMVMNEGQFRGQQVLTAGSIERLFTNHTRDLPIDTAPFPPAHPNYPYGVTPDYGFGGWVLAEHPATQHVEEVIGAGAWGSYVWLDRRRGLTAVLITDVPAGSQSSIDAALGLFAVARSAVEERQVEGLEASVGGPGVTLTWTAPPGALGVRVVGSTEPIQDVFDLSRATPLGMSRTGEITVPAYPHYAATAVLGAWHNTALIPGVNSIAFP